MMAGKGTPVETIVKAETDESATKKMAVVPDSLAVAAAAAGDGGEAQEEADGVKLVAMPERHVRWILSQEMHPVFTLDDYSVTTDLYQQEFLDEKRELLASIRESLLASRDDFAAFQASIRETYERGGRVMVPAVDEAQRELDRLSAQEEINRIFAQAKEEFERDHAELVKLIAEVEAKTEAEQLGLMATEMTTDDA